VSEKQAAHGVIRTLGAPLRGLPLPLVLVDVRMFFHALRCLLLFTLRILLSLAEGEFQIYHPVKHPWSVLEDRGPTSVEPARPRLEPRYHSLGPGYNKTWQGSEDC
jgi:hypothetical protein